MSIKLKEILENKGYKVFMTRENDVSLSSGGSVKQQKRDDLNKRCIMKRESLEINPHSTITDAPS